MNTDLHKMLEEAKREGYKEAIEAAKRWLKEHFFVQHHLALYWWSSKCDDIEEALETLETDMNKLWEE